jgi:hypothetical protein
MKMKVIFLDIDGVINSINFLEKNKPELIDRTRVELLKVLIEQTGAIIVCLRVGDYGLMMI